MYVALIKALFPEAENRGPDSHNFPENYIQIEASGPRDRNYTVRGFRFSILG